MQGHLHRLVSRVVDDVSFGAINALHWRQRAHPEFPSRLQSYIDGWADATFEDYYKPPVESTEARAFLENLEPITAPRQLRFPSPLPSPYPANNHATYDLFPCAANKGSDWTAPTLLLTHGLMSVSDIGYRIWAAKWNARGWNVIFIHLPYHYARRPAGTLSGELSVTADLVRTAEAARQAVIELRLLLEWLAARGGTFFAGCGTSYGAWILALLGCVEPRLNRMMLIEPILDIQAAVWESPACAALRRSLRRQGITPEHTERHLRLCCPLQCTPPPWRNPHHVLMMAGNYDRIAPPATIRALHEKWVGSHYYAFAQGHIGYKLLPESFRLAELLWPDDFSRSAR